VRSSLIQITFFHDVLCPFCYVTNKRLRKVLQGRDDVRVKHKAFMIISSLDDLLAAAP